MESPGEEENHNRGSVREVAGVSWPIVIGMLSYTGMGVADTLVVGWLGVTELAAVGVATMVVFLINSFFLGTLHGTKVLVAQATGAEDPRRAGEVAWLGVALAVPAGLLVIALGWFDESIFALIGGPANVQEGARAYFSARLWGAPVWYVTIAMADYFQGSGDTRTPMKLNLVVNGLNVVLDIVLVFGLGPIPALGLVGAAWATVAASAIGMLALAPFFVRRVAARPRWDGRLMWRVLQLGLPIGVRYSLEVGGFAVFTAVVARMGEAELAANQVAFKIISVSFLPGHGLGEAATVLVGQYIGARDLRAARASYRSAVGLSIALMGAFGVLFWLVPEHLVAVFHSDARVVEVASSLLLLAAFFQVFDAVAMTASGALNGAGDTAFSMWVSLAGSWLVLVPLTYVFGVVLDHGAWGAWLALTAEITLLAVVLSWRWRNLARVLPEAG